MPYKTYNTKADYDEDYRISVGLIREPDATIRSVNLNYHRGALLPGVYYRAMRIGNVLGWLSYTQENIVPSAIELATWNEVLPEQVYVRTDSPTACVLYRRQGEWDEGEYFSITVNTPAVRVILVGAGFSWTAEAFEDFGFTNVVGIDTGTYVQANKDTSEEAEIDAAITAIGLDPTTGPGKKFKDRSHKPGNRSRASRGVLNEDLKTGGSRNRVKQAINNGVDCVLTEELVNNYTDAEIVDISNTYLHHSALDGAMVVHYVTTTRPGNAVNLNWKTLEEWAALLPLDVFIESGTFRFLPDPIP